MSITKHEIIKKLYGLINIKTIKYVKFYCKDCCCQHIVNNIYLTIISKYFEDLYNSDIDIAETIQIKTEIDHKLFTIFIDFITFADNILDNDLIKIERYISVFIDFTDFITLFNFFDKYQMPDILKIFIEMIMNFLEICWKKWYLAQLTIFEIMPLNSCSGH